MIKYKRSIQKHMLAIKGGKRLTLIVVPKIDCLRFLVIILQLFSPSIICSRSEILILSLLKFKSIRELRGHSNFFLSKNQLIIILLEINELLLIFVIMNHCNIIIIIFNSVEIMTLHSFSYCSCCIDSFSWQRVVMLNWRETTVFISNHASKNLTTQTLGRCMQDLVSHGDFTTRFLSNTSLLLLILYLCEIIYVHAFHQLWRIEIDFRYLILYWFRITHSSPFHLISHVKNYRGQIL